MNTNLCLCLINSIFIIANASGVSEQRFSVKPPGIKLIHSMIEDRSHGRFITYGDSGNTNVLLFIADVLKTCKRTNFVIVSHISELINGIGAMGLYKPHLFLDELSSVIDFRQLELGSKSDVIYLVVMNRFLNQSNHVMDHIRESGGKSYILYISLLSWDPNLMKTFPFYNIFAAVFDGFVFNIFEKCAYCNKGMDVIREVNYWSANLGFAKDLHLKNSFKNSFHGRSLKVTFSNDAQGITSRFEQNGLIDYFGPEYDMLLDVSRMIDFGFYLEQPQDGEWGMAGGREWLVCYMKIRRI